uniref:HTH OST-type domain-containing protein n=1 Tax=Anopheles minimus TaxID=112268 RepID=A0A182W7I2_9DIPT
MDELKTLIRALAISNAANGITVAQLNKDFKNLEGYAIPYSKFGFQSLDGMLRTMTDAVRVSGYGLTAVVQPLVNEKTKHVREMVKKSKSDRKKHSLYQRYPQSDYSNNFYNNNYSSHFDDNIDNGDDNEIVYTSAFHTDKTNNNTPKQHSSNRLGNGELYKVEQPKATSSAYKSVQKTPVTSILSEKTPDKTTTPLTEYYKKPTNHIPDMANAKPPIFKTDKLTVPVEAMTIKEKVVEEALSKHVKQDASIQVVVTAVLNPRHLFVHLLEHTDRLLELAPHVHSFYSAKATEYEWLVPETMVQVGLYCAAKYYDRWYRAQVMGPLNYQRVLLLYIDYGYLRYVPLKEIRFLTRELASIPRQAIRVALKYLKPTNGTWSQECSVQLANLVHRKVFEMHVVDVDVKENMLDVVLTGSSNSSVHSFVHHRDNSNCICDSAKIVSRSTTKEWLHFGLMANSQQKSFRAVNIFERNAPCTATHMMSSYHNLEQLKPIIRSMVMSHRNKTVCVQELQRDFRDIEGLPIPYKQLGFADIFELLHAIPDIVQVSTINGIPVITHVSSPATEHVEQLIQRSTYRRRGGRKAYARYSPNACNVRNNLIQRFEQSCNRPNTEKKAITMEIQNDCFKPNDEQIRSLPKQPTAKESFGETCEHVNGSVMSWKPYCDMWDSVNMIDLPSGVMGLTHTMANVDITQYFAEKAETIVRVLYVLNPNRMWLRSAMQDKTVKQLQVDMEAWFHKLQNTDWCLEANKVQHGMYCAIQNDNIWYRARIVGPLIGIHVKLFYIDTGLIELADYKRIKYLPFVFSTIPAQAIRASLACLIPKNNAWTREESDDLSASITDGGKALNAYTLNLNRKLRVLDIVLMDANKMILNEQFAVLTDARWTGMYYLSQDPEKYRNKRQSFNEKHPSFFCIEQGHFPTIGELRSFVSRYFDYEELYTRLPHFDQNGIVEKISQATNEKMVKLYGIVSASDQESVGHAVEEPEA